MLQGDTVPLILGVQYFVAGTLNFGKNLHTFGCIEKLLELFYIN